MCHRRTQRNPAFTTLTPTKWKALSPPPGSSAELAPSSQLYAYLDELRCAPDTRAFLAARPYRLEPEAAAAASNSSAAPAAAP